MKLIYPKCITDYMEKKGVLYVPRKLRCGEHLKLYRRYFQLFPELYFKVIDIYDVGNREYYSIKYQDLNGETSYPVNKNTYEMMIDKNDISKLDNIINTKISYTGAEIKFWFYTHNIDLESEKYSGFWSFLFYGSKNEISDEKSYFVYSTLDNNGNYRKCKFSMDKK